MNLVQTFTHEELFPELTAPEDSKLVPRPTVKVVAYDGQGLIALVSKKERDFYFLPGGGIEDDETAEEALRRECLEEIGCNIGSIKPLGRFEEERKKVGKQYVVYGYMGKVEGEKEKPQLTPSDIERGIAVTWHTPEEAISQLEKQLKAYREESSDKHYTRIFNTVRDLAIIRKA